jgi:hypothetical protein
MATLRVDEEWARQLIEAALDAPTVQHDDGSEPGMYDLAVHLPSGDQAAAEVTAAADPACVELWKLMNGGDERWIEDDLQGGWNGVPLARRTSCPSPWRAACPAA